VLLLVSSFPIVEKALADFGNMRKRLGFANARQSLKGLVNLDVLGHRIAMCDFGTQNAFLHRETGTTGFFQQKFLLGVKADD
jgi:hypothetical protein